uniref:uncharacterized protein LOC122599020 isoform X2 n=1 Tax=Erigeron canadensis TaxID=72917 RepID=UPI001CB8948A|nr:uncharacterized protein LOC122599020 isoform X2 [Erigeron canadensis]
MQKTRVVTSDIYTAGIEGCKVLTVMRGPWSDHLAIRILIPNLRRGVIYKYRIDELKEPPPRSPGICSLLSLPGGSGTTYEFANGIIAAQSELIAFLAHFSRKQEDDLWQLC